MCTTTQVLQQVAVELKLESMDAASPIDARVNVEDRMRSENNILMWMSYLPEDCVKTMIVMGWNATT
jgi:hypothetical protein